MVDGVESLSSHHEAEETTIPTSSVYDTVLEDIKAFQRLDKEAKESMKRSSEFVAYKAAAKESDARN